MAPFMEDDLLPLSGLQHFVFCERQWGLIHLEGAWSDNALTVQGSNLHTRVHGMGATQHGDIRVCRGLAVRSLQLGITGKVDVVEFHRTTEAFAGRRGVHVPGLPGLWRALPVEYKRGRPKEHAADEVQLCAQALCLEEMLGGDVTKGAVFYGRTRRRTEVAFESALREMTCGAIRRMREFYGEGRTPPPRRRAKCQKCSLRDVCMPRVVRRARSVRQYLTDAVLSDGECSP